MLTHRDTEQAIIESALIAIQSILTLPTLEKHKRELINGMLWKLTEARGKYTTRYQTARARTAPKGRSSSTNTSPRESTSLTRSCSTPNELVTSRAPPSGASSRRKSTSNSRASPASNHTCEAGIATPQQVSPALRSEI